MHHFTTSAKAKAANKATATWAVLGSAFRAALWPLPEAEHSVLSLFKSTSSSDHNENQSQVTTQRRIHGNLKTKDTEMMLQWLQQEKVSPFLLHPCHPTIFPFHSSQVCTLSANSIYHTNGENKRLSVNNLFYYNMVIGLPSTIMAEKNNLFLADRDKISFLIHCLRWHTVSPCSTLHYCLSSQGAEKSLKDFRVPYKKLAVTLIPPPWPPMPWSSPWTGLVRLPPWQP